MKQFIIPYMFFKDTKKAVDYYLKVFGGEISYTMYGKDDPNCPPGREEDIWHLQYNLHGHEFYMADDTTGKDGNIHLHLDFEDLDEMKKAFGNMAKEGDVKQELGETFWGAIYGYITDPFGVTWQFHYSLPREE